MSDGKIYLVEGDNLPVVTITVKTLDGEVADLTGATSASVFMRERDVDGAVSVEIPATIDIPNSQVSFEFADDVLVAGDFVGETVLTFTTKQQTLYKPLSIKVRARRA